MVSPPASPRLVGTSSSSTRNQSAASSVPAPDHATQSSVRNQPQQPLPLRRSSRQAALDANVRISQGGGKRQKRDHWHNQIHSHVTTGECEDESTQSPDEMENQKVPAAPKQHNDDGACASFTCPICLDCPSSVDKLATISGCNHKFCFNCINTWAKTKNHCPYCKSRFRRIECIEEVCIIEFQKRGSHHNHDMHLL